MALLVQKDLGEKEMILLAIGLYAVYRTVNTIRFSANGGVMDPSVLLRMFAKQGAAKHSIKSKYLS